MAVINQPVTTSETKFKGKSLNTLFDDLVKSPKIRFSVIPAKAGIQSFQIVINSLDSGFHRSDDFLRDHLIWNHQHGLCCH